APSTPTRSPAAPPTRDEGSPIARGKFTETTPSTEPVPSPHRPNRHAEDSMPPGGRRVSSSDEIDAPYTRPGRTSRGLGILRAERIQRIDGLGAGCACAGKGE